MTEIDERLSTIVKACDDKKAFDIKVLNIQKISSIGDYFVIASGNSTSQVTAIADEIDEKMSKIGFGLVQKEGYSSARWILLDYGDIIVHVFHREDRSFYNLERLWSDSEEVDISLLIS
ncbi:ribosome silencing factor [Sporanaerobacter acetigenes]|uniref:Ribosomal silencing factor RsfS n=1 Tax=Sporanaerobacter acetigenes DSM 13106 TaxID=1123281 RepID=A0A1M5UVB7_9FIRM|nr:ribosome silencing factor [Sporanaerobacter acetigenes]SHH66889.1 ribosome-associated protein [Sporanaerobacter acetigenes DSM 13106]